MVFEEIFPVKEPVINRFYEFEVFSFSTSCVDLFLRFSDFSNFFLLNFFRSHFYLFLLHLTLFFNFFLFPFTILLNQWRFICDDHFFFTNFPSISIIIHFFDGIFFNMLLYHLIILKFLQSRRYSLHNNGNIPIHVFRSFHGPHIRTTFSDAFSGRLGISVGRGLGFW